MSRKHSPNSTRRAFLQTATLGGVVALTPALAGARELSAANRGSSSKSPTAYQPQPFDLEEITISDLQDGLKSGKFTARSLVEKYWVRVSDVDMRDDNGRPVLNSVIEMNPDALAIAESVDKERQAGKFRRPTARHSGPHQRQHRHR